MYSRRARDPALSVHPPSLPTLPPHTSLRESLNCLRTFNPPKPCVCVRERERVFVNFEREAVKLRVVQELEVGLGDSGPLEAGLGGVIEPGTAQTAGDHGNGVNALTRCGMWCVVARNVALTCGLSIR